MRFDSSLNPNFTPASDIINSSSKLELAQIFKRFGEERFASNVADAIIEARQGTLILTTG
jgi:16S rRNA C1402 N4-methylase RsmH